MKKSVSILPVMALSAAFLAACTDDSSSSNPATPDQASSSSEMLLPGSSDIAPGSSNDLTVESSSSEDVFQAIDPSAITLDEDGFADIKAVYRSLQANEKAVFVVRHAERDQFVTRQGELTEDGEEQALEVGRKMAGPDEFTFSHTDYVRTYKTCFNIATGRGQATFPNDTNDIYSGDWFVVNDSLYDAYSAEINNTHILVSSWAYNGQYADAFYDLNERGEEMVKMLVGDYATASRVKVVCSHDNFVAPLTIYLTNKTVNLRVFEFPKKWLNFVAGVAIITNDAGERRTYAVKGLESGVQ
ncbi:MAG: histidine phosphatase family protein [Fibrobacter sp.]|nr:histidine phosphatase family protein [Fibrobacter sp.]